jgi:hypothetical protein
MTKRMFFVLSAALVLGLLTACGTGANTNGNGDGTINEAPKQAEIAAKFHPSIETREESNSIIISYKVKNISGKSQKLTFPSGLQADFIVFDQMGAKVKQYSDELMSTQAIEEVLLENNQEIEKGFTINDLYNGQFKIEVFLTAEEEQAKVVTDLIVETSLYNKGQGKLVGQIDPHTVEIDSGSEKTAFQLSNEAIQQVLSLKEGELVLYIFTENDFGQKTIEKFLMDSK